MSHKFQTGPHADGPHDGHMVDKSPALTPRDWLIWALILLAFILLGLGWSWIL